jgi:5-methyltetrahydrofolate--homocysteine methyltransferase
MTLHMKELLHTSPILLDGGWGTQLQTRGLQPGECPDAWNLSHPDAVEAVARAYVAAGSAVILTNTFGANHLTLARHGLAAKMEEINRRGVEISRHAAGKTALVFASIGPSGMMLVSGEVKEEELQAAFVAQARALAGAGADALVIETMSDLTEASIAVAAARATGLPIVASMSFDSGPQNDRTLMGVSPEQAAKTLAAAGADVIGANCGQSIDGYLPLCRRLRAATTLPIWLKPNAGAPELVNGKAVYRQSPEDFAAQIPALVQAGAQFIGGCCGTSPDFIRVISSTL